MNENESEQIESLLRVWYRWQIRQSHAVQLAHYYRPEDRTCRGYDTPMSDEELDERAGEWVEDQISEQVQLCVDRLSAEQRAAVSVSMRNKECGANVWSNARAGDQHATYQAAKSAMLPMLIAKFLIKIGEAA
ncbi:hypothetical protein [Burkholderia gladioli]|uniref:hypothetical protein n=1 Tax=Burkholderia gladioli TaxID=28095 RepID=UPI00163E1C5B|nr:hypothetical protein [Burkholderia gladioli]